jgi:hypothetical protein
MRGARIEMTKGYIVAVNSICRGRERLAGAGRFDEAVELSGQSSVHCNHWSTGRSEPAREQISEHEMQCLASRELMMC